jgi:hypothetical protein
VNYINDWVKKDGEGKCVESLQLAKVHRAERLETASTNEHYQIQFETTPGGGIFEGEGLKFKVNLKGTFVKFINETYKAEKYFSRVNAYGNLPCSPSSSLRQFCVCK